MIDRGEVSAILPCNLFMLRLSLRWLEVPLICERLFLSGRPGSDTIRSAIEAGAVVVVHYSGVVDVGVVNDCPVYIHHSGVVGEGAATPFTAIEAGSTIPEAIVDAAVETDMRSPVPGVPSVDTSNAPTPISRRPQVAGLRS